MCVCVCVCVFFTEEVQVYLASSLIKYGKGGEELKHLKTKKHLLQHFVMSIILTLVFRPFLFLWTQGNY